MVDSDGNDRLFSLQKGANKTYNSVLPILGYFSLNLFISVMISFEVVAVLRFLGLVDLRFKKVISFLFSFSFYFHL